MRPSVLDLVDWRALHRQTSTTALLTLLARIIDRSKQTRAETVVCGINDRILGPLFAFDILDRIPDDRIVVTEKEARDPAWSLL